jgi:hypothetical protein
VLAGHLDGAAEVHEEGPVGHLVHVDVGQPAQGVDDVLGVHRVRGGAGDVDPYPVVIRGGDVQGGDEASDAFDGRGQAADGRPSGRDVEPDGDRVREIGSC